MIKEAILHWAQARKPDFIVGGVDNPYLMRYWLIPRNRFFNIYVHQFRRSDDDRALHCHPWLFNASWIIQGEYTEHTIAEGGVANAALRKAGAWKFRWGRAPHRVELHAGWCWTVFVTGPVVRMWGFHCPRGWVPWQQFVSARDKGSVGRGCD